MRISLHAVLFALVFSANAGVVSAAEGGHAAGWQRQADNEIGNLPSLQRGARNFMGYCSGCHSLKFVRYSRICEDLKIAEAQCEQLVVRPGDKAIDYIKSSMPAADATEWFGKPPPDLSLVSRSRGTDWVFNFLTTFYADPASQKTGVNNLQLPGTAMPHVLSSLQGVPNAVWRNVEHKGEGGEAFVAREFEKFEPGVTGSVTPAEYDDFVRDTVNFLQYAGDPTQLQREGIGIWVILFLLMFSGIAYMLKKEYWKDVR